MEVARKRSSESLAGETFKQKLMRLLGDEEPSESQEHEQEYQDEIEQDQGPDVNEGADTSQDDDAWKMVGELDMVKNLLRSTLAIKTKEIEFLRKENAKVCEGLEEAEEVWARFEIDIKDKEKRIESKEYELQEKDKLLASIEQETKKNHLALEKRLEAATRKISELNKLKNNEHKHVRELLDDKMKMEKDNKALTKKCFEKGLRLEICKSDLKLLQEKISGFDAIKNNLLVMIEQGNETIAVKEKHIRENELVIKEAKRKFRELQQTNQDILIMLEEKEATIRNINVNLNQEEVEAKKKEEFSSAKMVEVLNQYNASLDVLELENKKLQKKNLILQGTNKKQVNKTNQLHSGMRKLVKSEMPHSKKEETLKLTLEKKMERVAEENVTTKASLSNPEQINTPEDNQKEEDSDIDKPSTSKIIGHSRDKPVTEERYNDTQKDTMFENVSPGHLEEDPVSSTSRLSETMDHGLAYNCDKCSFTSNTMDLIRTHKDKEHKVEDCIKCKKCDFTAPFRVLLRRHELKNHPKNSFLM